MVPRKSRVCNESEKLTFLQSKLTKPAQFTQIILPTLKVTWILGSTEAAPELAGRGKVPLPAFNRVVELFAGSADTLQGRPTEFHTAN